ncbi:MAG: hypothetical protein HZB68_03470, partial [Candidatus Aenigmarchaeota archaeon]|nr:hypothetical protein [Candidatus Aenigmarchaeota archaeon]
TVSEGLAKVMVPDVKKPEDGIVFYNPEMEFDRDISVAFLKAFPAKRVLDGFGASGIRGIRYSLECDADVTINDANPECVETIKENLKLNGANANVTNDDVNVILRKQKFDFVDIDPFGTPAPFFDSSSQAFRKEGYAAFTATDTAVLCGVYTNVSLRRYGAPSERGYLAKELGLRILITGIISSFARNDFSFIPMVSYSKRHYFRVYGRVEKGSDKADCAIESLKERNGYKIYLGPLNSGSGSVANEIEKLKFTKSNKEKEFLESIGNEIEIPFFHDIESLTKEMPRIDSVVGNLQKQGFSASRTHFLPTGLKTDANIDEIQKAIKACRTGSYRT